MQIRAAARPQGTVFPPRIGQRRRSSGIASSAAGHDVPAMARLARTRE
ncbi:MAG: hypothetical protein GYA24_25535, partial [Candidatus Lokiarchaeota archaeon]|nr:hypothetical protein [Candidatus Lokiarchaeota archaeon]